MNLDLTDKERLMLANQYEILAKLGNDEHSALIAETLRDGHKWLYHQLLQDILPNLPDEKADFVLEILGIYRDMKKSYDLLFDKGGIEEQDVRFPGFDGNNETDLLFFTKRLIKHHKFVETLGEHGIDSHGRKVEIYDRMIRCWHSLGAPTYPYSKENIQKILAARRHQNASAA
ncbi:uncharacterized protein YfbU (UPF0304 family) [Oxalobacteraceae bacterium GrIS 1.11]